MSTNSSVEINEVLEVIFTGKSSLVARDLKLNLQKLMNDGALDKKEAALTLLAVATSLEFSALIDFSRVVLKHHDFSDEQINEAAESSAIMGMLNIYYRTKHFLTNSNAENVETNYKAAGLRMTSLAKPALGKEYFEMLAFAVSCVNGCEQCVNSHEAALRAAGIEPNKIHDLIRIAAVTKGLKALSTIK
jgi:alkyl hydroperoxide reductase subunit D